MKVLSSIETTFIPMKFEDEENLWKTRRQRDEHWARLKRARSDCPFTESYFDWLERVYGLRLKMTLAEMISDEYTVVDEKKYTMYLLKYSQ